MVNKLNLKIDKEKCIHCGLCVKDCSCSVLTLNEEKIPTVAQNGETRCMKCQHCLAVCPTGALSILGKKPQNSIEILKNHNPEALLNLIQSRKSIRQFKKQNVDKKTIKELQEMLKWAPTGCNNHGLAFTFIDDMDALEEFKTKTYTKLKELYAKRPFPKEATKLLRLKEAVNAGLDPIFRNTPHMVIVSAPDDAPCADIDPIIALSYFDLYAQSIGVGTLWCGLAFYCLELIPELVKDLKIPNGYKPKYCMLFGYPDVQYKRCTQPENFKIMTYGNLFGKFKVMAKNLYSKIMNFVKK